MQIREDDGKPLDTPVKEDLRYDGTLDLKNLNNSQSLLYAKVIDGLAVQSNVLEIGCATGRLGEQIRKAGHRVVGIEPNAVAASEARRRLDDVFVGSLEQYLIEHSVHSFQAVVMGDVLEHLSDPERHLRKLAEKLLPDARLVLSVPNVANGAVRAALLRGCWQYGPLGLLDVTHLRFFTFDSLMRTLEYSGWCAESVCPIYVEGEVVNQRYQLGASDLSLMFVNALTSPEDANIFQVVIRARPSNAERLRLHQYLFKKGPQDVHCVAPPRRELRFRQRIQLAWKLLAGKKLD